MDIQSLLTKRGLASLARRLSLAALFFLGFAASPAKAQDIEGKNVSEVAISYRGSATIDEGRLRNSISTRAGEAYRSEKVDNDIKSLYESGLVNDVRVLAEPVGESLKVIFEVATRGQIVAVGFTGNTVFSDTKLAKETKLKVGGALSDDAILTARRNLETYYRGYGYPDVVISHRTQPSESGTGEDLIFIIEEGGKNEIRDIRFEGNSVFDGRTLRKQMKVKEKGFFSWISKSGRFEVDQLDSDLEAVLDYYRTHGYLRVSGSVRRDAVGDGRVDLVIQINEGAKYTVAGVGFGRMTVFKPEELYPALSLNGGDAYSSKKMRDDIKMIRSYYGSRGYADATVTPDIRDAGPNQVNIVYRITEGSRYRVGRINIGGNTKTQDKVIRREMPLKPGDWFNSVELDTAKARLDNLQYFNSVQVDSSDGRGGYRDIDVLVDERRTGSISAGIGFSSIDSIVGFINLEQTNFDIMNPWAFTGAGQRFGMNLRLGSERTDFSVSLVEPWFMDQQLALGGELFYKDSQYYSDFYEQTNAGFSAFIRKPWGEKGSIKLEYRLENVSVDVESAVGTLTNNWLANNPTFPVSPANPYPRPSLLDEDGDFVRSALGLNYVYDSRDAVIETRSGEKFDIGLTLAGSVLGGDVDIYSLSVQGQKYWNLAWDSIFSLNGELAFVDATSGEVPIFDRLFLGGGRTLRGFEFRDVGPRDSITGEVVGGKSLGFLSAEYTVPVIDNVRAAVFYDLGFVNEGAWDPSPSDLYHDFGVGVRLKLPISPVPIALDYAIPIDSPDPLADNGGQFNFYLNYQY
ncbi:outer membrane protein assembly factor BamA [Luteolibacter flavescens]|uniref:Outer membrane protein assembly factor BamA n=1 Tax=Luteolibacter flavescens TaxID=1859460 RepID=A0ABT3FVJ0_9BACT|nr:outer membrane protein assembly factor BamA [Luteolibacter flavescens]MCW1887600.1 outer membrane protein assembly factor BamA [Luteolibacter flavescens]